MIRRPSLAPNAARLAATALAMVPLLAGCAGYKNPDTSIVDAAALPVTCYSAPDCQAKFQRARTWLKAHTSRKIVEDQASLTTERGAASDTSPIFTVTLVPNGASSAVIQFTAECPHGCSPNEDELRGEFNLYLSRSDAAG